MDIKKQVALRQIKNIEEIIRKINRRLSELSKQNIEDSKEFLGLQEALEENTLSLVNIQRIIQVQGGTDVNDIRKMFMQMTNEAFKNALMFTICKSDTIQDAIWALEDAGFAIGHVGNAYKVMINKYGKENILETIKKETQYLDFVISALNNDPQYHIDWEWIMENNDAPISFKLCCEFCGMSVGSVRFAFRRITRLSTDKVIQMYNDFRGIQIEQEAVLCV